MKAPHASVASFGSEVRVPTRSPRHGMLNGASPPNPSKVAPHDPKARVAETLLQKRAAEERIATIVRDHMDFVFRILRRTGIPNDAIEDAAQQVFVVVARKLDSIPSENEKAYLFQTSIRVSSEVRRSLRRRREERLDEAIEGTLVDPSLNPDDRAYRTQLGLLLDQALLAMPADLRHVFVLFELEGMSMAEIALTIEIPNGTVASRLRRAREHFQLAIAKIQKTVEDSI